MEHLEEREFTSAHLGPCSGVGSPYPSMPQSFLLVLDIFIYGHMPCIGHCAEIFDLGSVMSISFYPLSTH